MNKSKIINVLSIDMDIIMEPCINLYNDLVVMGNINKLWSRINELRDVDRHLSVNVDNIKIVFDIFVNKLMSLKDKTNVTFAENHDTVLNRLTDKEYGNCKFNIFNIDHHHDINYSDEQKNDVDNFDYTTYCNWVWYLDKYDLINEFYWIKNRNSELYRGPDMLAKMSIVDINNIHLQDVVFDYIFICRSQIWVPSRFNHYFEMLLNIYKNITGISAVVEQKPYCEQFQSKPLKKY